MIHASLTTQDLVLIKGTAVLADFARKGPIMPGSVVAAPLAGSCAAEALLYDLHHGWAPLQVEPERLAHLDNVWTNWRNAAPSAFWCNQMPDSFGHDLSLFPGLVLLYLCVSV